MDEAIYAPKKLGEWLVKFAFCVHCSASGVDGKIQRMSEANIQPFGHSFGSVPDIGDQATCESLRVLSPKRSEIPEHN
jgi:hypothetical protein